MIGVLFDLDGTLTESSAGIFNSIKYALEKVNRPIPDEETLRLFIGPPLLDSFKEHCNMTEEEALETYAFFGERYTTIGKYENELYPNIEEVLKQLRKANAAYIGIATAKPEDQARDIIKHFELDKYFDVIRGANREAGLVKKEDILREALADMKTFTEQRYKVSRWYMVGDRKYDMEAAKKLGCRAIGVTYGFGTEEELKAAGADYIAETTSDIIVNIMVDSLL